MAEEIVTIQVPVDAPENIRTILYDINNKFSKLAQVLYGNLDISALRSGIVQKRVRNGEPNKIVHNLDKEAVAVILCSGRVQAYTMINSALNSVTVKPHLMSTIASGKTVKFTNQIEVANPSFLRVGDEIKIANEFIASVKNIKGNVITLSKEVYFSGVVGVTLNTEFTQFLII